MLLGIVADIHCNVGGLRQALDRMGPVDQLLCAGDAIYQFRFSNEVIELLRERDARYILGNHELTIPSRRPCRGPAVTLRSGLRLYPATSQRPGAAPRLGRPRHRARSWLSGGPKLLA